MGNLLLRIGSLSVQTGNAEGIKAPSAYSVKHADVDVDSSRSMSGYMNRNRVRGNVVTITCTWNKLTWEELVKLTEATNGSSINVSYLDPSSKGLAEGIFYRDANIEYTLLSYTETEAYWSTTLNLVEY